MIDTLTSVVFQRTSATMFVVVGQRPFHIERVTRVHSGLGWEPTMEAITRGRRLPLGMSDRIEAAFQQYINRLITNG